MHHQFESGAFLLLFSVPIIIEIKGIGLIESKVLSLSICLKIPLYPPQRYFSTFTLLNGENHASRSV